MKRDSYKLNFETIEELTDFLKDNQTGTVVHFMYDDKPTTGRIYSIKIEKVDMSMTHTTTDSGKYKCEIKIIPKGSSTERTVRNFYSTKEEMIQDIFGIAPCAVSCQNFSPAETK